MPSRTLTESEGHLASIAADIQQAARPGPLAALPLQLLEDKRHARIACRRRCCCYRCIGRSGCGADVVVGMEVAVPGAGVVGALRVVAALRR